MSLYLAALFAFAGVWLAPPAQRWSTSKSMSTGRIMEAIAVKEGGTVCEIGAGDGASTIAAARIVGPAGHVYTSELGDTRVKRLRQKIAASGLAQITVVAGEATRTNFPEGGCDGVFLRDVYHHFTDPAAMNRSIAASLKPGGRVAVVDFTPPGEEAAAPDGRASDGRHGIRPETVSREMKDAGLETTSSELPERRWFMVVLAKPGAGD